MSNLNNIRKELFNKIRGRFPSITIGNESGEITTEPEEAKFFSFSYHSKNQEKGDVTIDIDIDDGLTVIYSQDFIKKLSSASKSEWYEFLKELRLFAMKRLLKFAVRDTTRSNLNKRDYKFLSQKSGDSNMNESTMYGTNRTSYQRVGNARLAIKHNAPINTESAAGRTQKIGNIFIESPDGERFKYPYRHLSGARAMARHVAEGGTAYDEFGQYISSLSEELSKLRKFNTYMNRSGVMAETLGEYTDIVKERAVRIRKEIQGLQKEAYYREAREGFTAPIVEDVPDDVSENWIDQLTIRQFNEELKDVFPYIYRLVGEATKTKELGPEDLDEADDPCWDGYKQIGMKTKDGEQVPNCVPEGENHRQPPEQEIEEHLEGLMGQFSESNLNEEDSDNTDQSLQRVKVYLYKSKEVVNVERGSVRNLSGSESLKTGDKVQITDGEFTGQTGSVQQILKKVSGPGSEPPAEGAGIMYMRFKMKKSPEKDEKGNNQTYLMAFAGFESDPKDVTEENSLRQFYGLKS
jgi:transcription antitermination factor NusG